MRRVVGIVRKAAAVAASGLHCLSQRQRVWHMALMTIANLSSLFVDLFIRIFILIMADTCEINIEQVSIGHDMSQKDNSVNGKKSKARRKTRSQRRKEKLQKLRLQQQQAGEEPRKYDDRVIVKDNPNLVKYYKLQSIVAQDEFDEFLEGLRTTLPASFRINTFDYGQAIFLRQLVQGPEFKEFLTNAPDTDTKITSNAPVLEPLPWYPQNLAWQMNVTRNDLKKTPILQRLHTFIMAETDNGFISRQESVSMIPPLVLDIHRGQKILDMCAAPGSKTAQLLEYLKYSIHGAQDTAKEYDSMAPMFDDGLVVANDVDNKRCYMLVHQSNRLNSPNCVIINEDASRLPKMKTFKRDGDDHQEIKFDRILCDAPCSGDGTVRKNPDVWRKWTTGNANNFHGLQSKILKRGVELLKEDGLIVYSTCSMNPVEDEAVVASILRLSQGGLVLEDCSDRLKGLKYRPGVSHWVVVNRDMEIVQCPEDVKPEQTSQIHTSLFPPTEKETAEFKLERCVRILPHIQNTGAFFVAVMRKVCSKLPWENDAPNNGTDDPSDQTDTAGDDQQKKRHAPNPKKRRYGGFREDPFVFMDSEDADWHQIRQFYGLSDSFPVKQLMHRSSTGKKRSIHLVSKETRNFMIANREEADKSDFVKLINGGMRLFARADTEAGFRICQDGVNEIVSYVKEDLKVPITKDDLKALLLRKSVPMDEFDSKSHLEQKLKPGSCILMYKHEQTTDSNVTESIIVPLVAWRGERSITLYVSNTFKVHLRALVDMKIGSINAAEVDDDNAKSTAVDDHAPPESSELLEQKSERVQQLKTSCESN